MTKTGTIQLGAYGALDHAADGAWPASTDGGYPIVYYTKDGGELCPGCANGQNGSDASVAQDDPQWKLIGADIFYDGATRICDHCGTEMESAYGDPDALRDKA